MAQIGILKCIRIWTFTKTFAFRDESRGEANIETSVNFKGLYNKEKFIPLLILVCFTALEKDPRKITNKFL
jgi:hypothetical protein